MTFPWHSGQIPSFVWPTRRRFQAGSSVFRSWNSHCKLKLSPVMGIISSEELAANLSLLSRGITATNKIKQKQLRYVHHLNISLCCLRQVLTHKMNSKTTCNGFAVQKKKTNKRYKQHWIGVPWSREFFHPKYQCKHRGLAVICCRPAAWGCVLRWHRTRGSERAADWRNMRVLTTVQVKWCRMRHVRIKKTVGGVVTRIKRKTDTWGRQRG